MSAWLLCFKATAIEVFNRRKGRRWDDAARMQLNSLSSWGTSVHCPHSYGMLGFLKVAASQSFCTWVSACFCHFRFRLLQITCRWSTLACLSWDVFEENYNCLAKGEWPMKRDVIGGYFIGRLVYWRQCFKGDLSLVMKLPGFCDTYCDRNDTCSNTGECNESESQQKAKCPLCASVSIVWFLTEAGFLWPYNQKAQFSGVNFLKKMKIKWCGWG